MFTEKVTMSWNSQKVVKLAFEASQPPEILHASVTFAYVTEKQSGEVPWSTSGDMKWQNLDVPEVPLFRVKNHKNVNFSALASSRLLKLHKSSWSSAVRTKM